MILNQSMRKIQEELILKTPIEQWRLDLALALKKEQKTSKKISLKKLSILTSIMALKSPIWIQTNFTISIRQEGNLTWAINLIMGMIKTEDQKLASLKKTLQKLKVVF